MIILSVLGICEIIYILRMIINYPGIRVKGYLVITLKKEYAIKQLNYIWKKIIWFGDTYATGVIAITDYLNFDEINSCLKYAYNKNIIFCCTNNLNECKFLQGDY
jgi:hypothetical protein